MKKRRPAPRRHRTRACPPRRLSRSTCDYCGDARGERTIVLCDLHGLVLDRNTCTPCEGQIRAELDDLCDLLSRASEAERSW